MPHQAVSQCASCGALHDCSPGYSCLYCGGVLGPVSVAGADELIRDLEAAEDPDLRPYLWDMEDD